MQARSDARRQSAWRLRVGVLVAGLLLVTSLGFAQFRRGYSVRPATAESFDGAFNFCRIAFSNARNGRGGNWSVDYPRADQNLSIRLSELTKAAISIDRKSGEPNHVLLQLSDPLLYRCPFIMMTEVGRSTSPSRRCCSFASTSPKAGFSGPTTSGVRTRGTSGKARSARCCRRVRIRSSICPRTIPSSIPCSRCAAYPQIPSINFWRGTGGRTSERGPDSATPRARAILDDHGRIMVFITHNTDIGDSFEHEGTDREYFVTFSVDGYALGINVLVYAMTH